MRSIAATALLLAACAPGPPDQAKRRGPALDPIDFFAGRTQGRGRVETLVGSGKALAVESVGRVRGNELTLDQRILLEGEEPRQRRWVIRRTGPGIYSASLTDATGPVRIEAVGRAIRIRYPVDGMRFEQWLAARPGGCALDNQMSVGRFGIELARITERIVKPPPCAPRRRR